MAIGRISGSVLKSNLTRNGTDLAFETNLLYLDVTNSRVGIGTSEPSTTLHVNGNTTLTGDLSLTGNLSTTSGSFSPGQITLSGNSITTNQSNADLELSASGTGRVLVNNELVVNTLSSDDSSAIRINDSIDMAGNIVPVAHNTYSLGTDTSRWAEVWVSGGTIHLGNLKLKDGGNNKLSITQSDGVTPADITTTNILTIVGDDSTGTTLNSSETFRFAGTGGISTSVSGDTLTIDGSAISTNSISEGNSSVTVADSGTGSITITADGNVELVINDTDATFSGPVVIKDRNTIVLNDTDNSNYIALRAPASVTANNTYTFPDGYGTSGQVMSTDGAGTLSWADAGGGGGGGGSSYPNSTLTTAPGTSGNYDLAEGPAQDGDETPFEAGGTDPFGVNLGSVFDAMDPIGTTTTLDYGDSEAYVGA